MKVTSAHMAEIAYPQNMVPGESQDKNIKFGELLNKAIRKVDELQKKADNSAVRLAAGDIQNLHQVMIDAEKAEIALQFTIQIRNKVIEAYQEIMRMQV